MSLADLKKNRTIIAQLEKMTASGRISHAFLFSGGTREDRDSLGSAFADRLLDRREDFLEISKSEDRATIGTAQISELQQKLMIAPFGAFYVVLLRDAEFLTLEAQNKLLKTLEEPENAILILLSERREAMLPTILSRCQSFVLEDPDVVCDPELDAAARKLIDAISGDLSYYKYKEIMDMFLVKKEDQRAKTTAFLDVLLDKMMDLVKTGRSEYIYPVEAAQNARKYIRQGHNVAYTLKQMCLLMQTRR